MRGIKVGSTLIILLFALACTMTACSEPQRFNKDNDFLSEGIIHDKPKEDPALSSPNTDISFNHSLSLEENLSLLNEILVSKYERSFALVSAPEYESENPTDWMLIVEDDRAGIDTATWKYGYNSDTDESRYMEAILTTFIFFYGDEMGNDLWLLTGDLIDGGADEREYGFSHVGGEAIYKTGQSARYGSANNSATYEVTYIWMTSTTIGATETGKPSS